MAQSGDKFDADAARFLWYCRPPPGRVICDYLDAEYNLSPVYRRPSHQEPASTARTQQGANESTVTATSGAGKSDTNTYTVDDPRRGGTITVAVDNYGGMLSAVFVPYVQR